MSLPGWFWPLLALILLLIIYAAYRWGEYVGSTRFFEYTDYWPTWEPVDPDEPEVELLEDTYMNPADVPITFYSAEAVVELEKTAAKAVTQARRYRTRAVNLEQQLATKPTRIIVTRDKPGRSK